jgi:hypothetical protein
MYFNPWLRKLTGPTYSMVYVLEVVCNELVSMGNLKFVLTKKDAKAVNLKT